MTCRSYSDSDWAGCPDTRSDPRQGSSCSFSALQSASPAEPRQRWRLQAQKQNSTRLGSAAAEGLHVKHFMEELDMFSKVNLKLHTDSSAAKAIVSRQGVGRRSKHIQLRFLYLQDLIATSIVTVSKVHTSCNPADIFTKHLTASVLQHLSGLCGLQHATVVFRACSCCRFTRNSRRAALQLQRTVRSSVETPRASEIFDDSDELHRASKDPRYDTMNFAWRHLQRWTHLQLQRRW